MSFSELGDDAEAVKEAERAVQLAPTDSAAHLNLAIAAKRTDMERAIAEARRAIELGPENFSAYQLLMKCLLESGRYQRSGRVRTGMAGGVALRRRGSFFCGCGNGDKRVIWLQPRDNSVM